VCNSVLRFNLLGTISACKTQNTRAEFVVVSRTWSPVLEATSGEWIDNSAQVLCMKNEKWPASATRCSRCLAGSDAVPTCSG